MVGWDRFLVDVGEDLRLAATAKAEN